ncbi:MAG: acetate--CoA ligase family protein [Gammaproteobacteria bacterium]|nr:acetate--CoA ligase family protein [Gammaproteobacteria bacterium]
MNPNRAEVQGLQAYPDLHSIPGPVDLVVVAVPADLVAGSVASAGECGAKALVIFSSGFAESGEEGRQRQDVLHGLCRQYGIRALGPNCLGVFNASIGHTATFASFLQEAVPAGGRIALVSQSGAYASYVFMLAAKRGIAIGKWVTTGNEMDVNIADAIDYLIDDPATSAIGCIAEGIRDGHSFLRALEKAHDAGKPVVLLKMGRTSKGAEAATSHTAALAVDDVVLDAVVKQAGALRVATTQDLIDVLYCLQLQPPLAGRKLGIVSVSGGAGVLMADAAAAHGFSLPPLPLASRQRLEKAIPFGSMANPVDVTAQALNDLTLAGLPIRAMLAEGGYDAVVAFFMNWLCSPVTGPELRRVLAETLEGLEGCTLALAAIGPEHVIRDYERQGFPVFDDPTRAIAALGAMARIGDALRTPRSVSPLSADMPLVAGNELDEVSAKAVLARAGVPVLAETWVAGPAAAAAAASAFGGPVALKIVSADLPHKSDCGGVRLGVEGATAVETAAAEMMAVVKRRCPGARIDGLLVSPMVSDGIEMVLATHVDPVFGPVVMVGFGGILVEVMRDVVFRYGPIGPDEAYRMIDELRGRRILDGLRGRPPADLPALANSLALLSHFGWTNAERLRSAEINPLLVRPLGKGCVALDALLTFATPKALPC